jgi:pimeloyl-ACP methyl ester carboxylesterase
MSALAARRAQPTPERVVLTCVDSAPREVGSLVAGDGEPVVMLHASLSAKSQWTPLMGELAPQFKAIALDLCGYGDHPLHERRGSGMSAPSVAGREPQGVSALGRPAGAHSIDDEADFVIARLDRLAGRGARVHLVGHSFGGLVALRIALAHPDRVISLSLFEPVAVRVLAANDPSLAVFRCVAADATALAAAGHLRNVAETVVDFWSGIGTYAAMPQRTQDVIARFSPKMPLDFEAAWGWRIDDAALRALHVPTLLMSGRRSPQVTRHIIARLSTLILDSRVAAFDCGHMGPITDPGVVNAAIAAFVRRHRNV